MFFLYILDISLHSFHFSLWFPFLIIISTPSLALLEFLVINALLCYSPISHKLKFPFIFYNFSTLFLFLRKLLFLVKCLISCYFHAYFSHYRHLSLFLIIVITTISHHSSIYCQYYHFSILLLLIILGISHHVLPSFLIIFFHYCHFCSI